MLKEYLGIINEKVKTEYVYAWDKAGAENCLVIRDSLSSSCSKKVYSDFLVHGSSGRKHIWASSERLSNSVSVVSFTPALSS